MTFTFEQIDEFTREYEIPIKQSDYDDRMKQETNQFAKEANLKGFRKGKTPRSLVKQRYGDSLDRYVTEDLVQERCQSLLRDESMNVSWFGSAYPSEPNEQGERVFKLRLETIPPIEIGDLAEISVVKPVVAFTEADARDEIRYAKESHAEPFELRGEDIVASEGDRVWFENVDADPSDPPREMVALLRDPKTEMAARLHAKILGKRVGDTFEITSRDVSNVGEIDLKLDESDVLTARLKRITADSFPVVGEDLWHRMRLGGPKPRNVNEFIHAARERLESSVETAAEQALAQQMLREASWRFLPSLPRQTVFNQYYAQLNYEYTAETAQYVARMELRIFDAIVDGEPLTTEIFNNAEAYLPDGSDMAARDPSTPIEPLPKEEMASRRANIRRAVQEVASRYTLQALIKHFEIEPDQEWIAEQIKQRVEEANRVADVDSRHEELDAAYSEENYDRLVSLSLAKQAQEALQSQLTIEEKHLSFNEFTSGEYATKASAERGSDMSRIARRAEPMKVGAVGSTQENETGDATIADGSVDESNVDGVGESTKNLPDAATTTSADEIVVAPEGVAATAVEPALEKGDTGKKPSLFGRLFGQKSNTEE